MDAAPLKTNSRSRLWFVLHGWLALPLWVFLFFVCLTGTIATIDREIMWLAVPSVRADNPGHLPAKPLNEVLADITRQIPGAHVARINFNEPYLALEVEISTPDAPNAVAWVNPFTGAVQSLSKGIQLPDFIRSLHGWLLMPWFTGTPAGWYLVCALSIPLLGSLITGLVVYKRFWKAIVSPRLRLRQGGRVLWGDVHRLAGVWGSWFIVTIAVTGFWFLVVGVMYDLHVQLGQDDPDIPRREAPVRTAGDPMPPLDLDGAVATARALSPGIRPMTVTLPEHALGTISIQSRDRLPLLSRETWINPYSGDMVWLFGADIANGREVTSMLAGSLHFGNFGGLWIKLIWTFFGLVLTSLVLSGAVVWTKRTLQASRAIAAPSRLMTVLRRLWFRGRFYLAALVLILPVNIFPFYLVEATTPPLGTHILPERRVGPFAVTLAEWLEGPPILSENRFLLKTYQLAIKDGYPNRIRSVYLRLGEPPNDRNLGDVMEGNPYRLHGDVRFMEPPKQTDTLWLTLEEWDGTLHQTSWPLPEVMTNVDFAQ